MRAGPTRRAAQAQTGVSWRDASRQARANSARPSRSSSEGVIWKLIASASATTSPSQGAAGGGPAR